MSLQLIFKRRYSMAHRLLNSRAEKCTMPHGHNEFIRVTLQANQDKPLHQPHNMLENFDEAKGRWHTFIDTRLDHALQLSSDDPLIDFFRTHEPHQLKRLVITPGDPTTEMLCACLMSKLQTFLDHAGELLHCICLEIQETPTNTVLLNGYRAFEKHLPQQAGWWQRADMSVNDLITQN